jgi:parallel beta-helix repeat protein
VFKPSCYDKTIYVNETGWWHEGGAFQQSGTPIQHAINNAFGGCTIIVKDGTYNENVDVSKQLTIKSENGSELTIVQAKNDDHVFKITADYVTISGFKVRNATGKRLAGIYLKRADHCTIMNNNISDNWDGIHLRYSNNNTISRNIASNNQDDGVHLWHSSHNNVSNNTANSNNDYGIYLVSSNDNTIYNNYFNNTQNAYDDGTNVWNSSKTQGTNIIGGLYLGGNYWSDYTGTDTDGDGLGETPYNIAGGTNKDYLPLVTPTLISITLSIDTVYYGSLAEAEHNTSPIITATNSGTVNETFYIRGDDAYYDLSTWTLAGCIGSNTFTHEFCNFSSADWYPLSNITNNTLAQTVPIGGNASFMLRITLPTNISSPGVYTTNVTIIATEAD